MGSIPGLRGGSKGSLGGKVVQRRPGRGEEVLGSSSDSDTHGCVTFRSLLNLSEPQILIREPEATIPRQGCSVIHANESSVRTVPAHCTCPVGDGHCHYLHGALSPSTQAPEAKLRRILGEEA